MSATRALVKQNSYVAAQDIISMQHHHLQDNDIYSFKLFLFYIHYGNIFLTLDS